jgi:integrase
MPKGMIKTKYPGVYKTETADGDTAFYYLIKTKERKNIWKKAGTRRQHRLTAHDVADIRAKQIETLRYAEPADNARPKTFGDAWKIYDEKWLSGLPGSQNNKGRYINHIAPSFKDVPLHQIKAIDLEDFKKELLTHKNLAPKTTKHILCLIGAVYYKMIKWDLYQGQVPTVNLVMPKVDNERLRFLTKEEANDVLNKLKLRHPKWWGIAAVSLYAGLRLNEVLSLAWGDINTEQGIIDVRFGKCIRRQAFMPDELKALFQSMERGVPSDLVFPSTRGEKISSSTASEAFSAVVDMLGLNDGIDDHLHHITFHSLRHTFASWLAIAGVEISRLMRLMGHKTITQTLRYSHLYPDTMRTSVQALSLMADNAGGIAGQESLTAFNPRP